MDALGLVVMVVAMGFFGYAQSRFFDGYVRRYGGPTREERQRLAMRDPMQYLRRVTGGRPFAIDAWFTRVPDRDVEGRRQLLLASLALLPVAAGFLIWTRTVSPASAPPPAMLILLGAGAAVLWGIVLVRTLRKPGLLRVGAALGVLAGITVALMAAAGRI